MVTTDLQVETEGVLGRVAHRVAGRLHVVEEQVEQRSARRVVPALAPLPPHRQQPTAKATKKKRVVNIESLLEPNRNSSDHLIGQQRLVQSGEEFLQQQLGGSRPQQGHRRVRQPIRIEKETTKKKSKIPSR